MPPPLPARVRISQLPWPPTRLVAAQLARLCPGVPLDSVQQAAAALAGGRVVGVALRVAGHVQPGLDIGIEAGWRGKGLEEALRAAVAGE